MYRVADEIGPIKMVIVNIVMEDPVPCLAANDASAGYYKTTWTAIIA